MKKLKYIFLGLSFLIITLTCSKSDNPISSNDDKYEIEKYKAYSDIINSDFNGYLYIIDSTASGYWIQNYDPSFLPDSLQELFPNLKLETIENYELLNQIRTKVKDKFNISLEYSLITHNTNFDFPDPALQLIDLTNIAFDELYSQAVLYFGYMQVHGGYGRFLFLEKVENTWTIKNIKYTWALE